MTRTDKGLLIEELKAKFENASFFYVTDASSMTVEKSNQSSAMQGIWQMQFAAKA